jgi:hypothetical protein
MSEVNLFPRWKGMHDGQVTRPSCERARGRFGHACIAVGIFRIRADHRVVVLVRSEGLRFKVDPQRHLVPVVPRLLQKPQLNPSRA